MFKRWDKKGQMTIFAIIALVIVLLILVYFLVRNNGGSSGVSTEMAPVFDFYSSCIVEKASEAADIAGSQGGKIYVENYEPGSSYAPFSSQLDFLGLPIPYWYYISGNGVIREQVPRKNDIENEISRYVQEELVNCDFEQFYSQGFSVEMNEAEVEVNMLADKLELSVKSVLDVTKGEDSARKSSYSVVVPSKMGKFYELAKEIYEKEKYEAFIENYSADVLYLYAPVDGVEIGCAPKVWKTREVVDSLKSALEANIAALRFSGEEYTLMNDGNKYFVIDKQVDENVNMIYSSDWPTKVDIAGEGVDEELMVVRAIGNQQGLSAMGFCYVPYHFVYDLSFPVLIQVYNEEEIFQFPVAVIIDKNMPRQAEFSEIVAGEEFELCSFKTQSVEVNVYDVELNEIDADISYGCFDQRCSLGKTTNGKFIGMAPACVNGFLYVRAENYSEKKQLFSSNSEVNADIILDKEYSVDVEVYSAGKKIEDRAVVVFDGVKSVSASLPDISSVMISEGLYNVSVYLYGNTSITIPASTKTQCTEVPESGLFGMFGGIREQCFDINLPETKVDYALLGGGRSEVYLLRSLLSDGKLKVQVDSFRKPNTIEDLQYNYQLFEEGGVVVE